MTDTPDNDAGDAEPITPEVVDGGGTTRRGASSRKRRVAPAAGDAAPIGDDAGTGLRPGRQPTGRLFHMASVLLVGVGLLELVLTVPAIVDPAKARCAAARNAIELANDDDEEFKHVDLPEGVDDADDLECDEALALAGQIPDDEDDEPAPDEEFALTESAILVPSVIFAVHGIACGVVGFLLRRRPNRRLRNTAIALVAIAIVPLAQLGVFGLAAVVFLIFAFAFSADAKAMFPRDPNTPGLFRPRPPPAAS